VLVANAFALAAAPELRPSVTALRAATMQFGYFAGSIAGGAALAAGGYGALGAAMGLLFLAAAATLAARPAARRRSAAALVASGASRWTTGFSVRWRSSPAARRLR
jgi:predicted MFS family arabinose efflux permease